VVSEVLARGERGRHIEGQFTAGDDSCPCHPAAPPRAPPPHPPCRFLTASPLVAQDSLGHRAIAVLTLAFAPMSRSGVRSGGAHSATRVALHLDRSRTGMSSWGPELHDADTGAAAATLVDAEPGQYRAEATLNSSE
jgi:hypothetical protein